MESKNNVLAYICAGVTIFFWASAFPAVKYALVYYSPGSLMLFRFTVATITIMIAAIISKAKLPAKEDMPYAIAGGAIGVFGYMWLFNTGTGMLQTGVSSFIIATAPIFSMILSALYLKEKLQTRNVIGVLISAVGLIMITVSQINGFSFNWGILIILLAAIFTSFYNIIQRKISFKYTAIECTTYSFVSATALMMIFLPSLISEFRQAPLATNAVMIYLGVFPAALSYLLWNCALGLTDKVTNVTNFMYLVPFVATAMSFLLLGEVLPLLSFLGGIVIIAGMIFSGLKPKKQSVAATSAQ